MTLERVIKCCDVSIACVHKRNGMTLTRVTKWFDVSIVCMHPLAGH